MNRLSFQREVAGSKRACYRLDMWLVLLAFASSAFAQMPSKSFQSALQDVLKGPRYSASLNQIRSIDWDYDSRDLVLEPYLSLSGVRANEERQILSTSSVRKTRVDTFGLGLTKPFSTGTTLSIGPTYENALIPSLVGGERSTFDWSLSLTQSLWQDFFGHSTSLRRTRESYQRKQELAGALLQQGQLLYAFETLYWDWALSLKQAELQAKNVKRSQEILKWVKDRFSRAAAESTDLLQARALLTQRELQVAAAQFSLTQVGTQAERFVPNRQWQPDPKDLSLRRDPQALLVNWKVEPLDQVQMLEYLQQHNEALAAEEKAKEARESIRPQLELQLKYGKNAIDSEGSKTLSRSFDEDHEYSSVGLVFRSGLDMGLEWKKVESARAARDAAKQRNESMEAENRVAWDQLKRELTDLQSRVERAQELVELQIQKANAERNRYRMGRSTAFQAITFEQEAAEAEISLWTLYALMRKTEAKARLFAR